MWVGLRMPSKHRQQKEWRPCLPHLETLLGFYRLVSHQVVHSKCHGVKHLPMTATVSVKVTAGFNEIGKHTKKGHVMIVSSTY